MRRYGLLCVLLLACTGSRATGLYPAPETGAYAEGVALLKRGEPLTVERQRDMYSNAKQIFWVQEEPENMGPWNAIKGRLYEAHGDTHEIHRVSRHESGSPATGSGAVHAQELQLLLDEALG